MKILLRIVSDDTLIELNYMRRKRGICVFDNDIIKDLEDLHLSVVDFLKLCIGENDFTLTPFDAIDYINNPNNIFRAFEKSSNNGYKNETSAESVINEWFNICVNTIFSSYKKTIMDMAKEFINKNDSNLYKINISNENILIQIPRYVIHTGELSEFFMWLISNEVISHIKNDSESGTLFYNILRNCITELINILSSDTYMKGEQIAKTV